MNNYSISPSILSADFSNLSRDLNLCREGGADAIHIDVMDGCFVPNISFGPGIVKVCKKTVNLPLDVHLMIVEPERHIKSFVDSGADRITVHYETCPHIHRTLQTIRELGVSTGITINPGTPVDVLQDLIGSFDLILIMSVNPGFGGQSFIPTSLNKIKKMHQMLVNKNNNAIIQVDGGVDSTNIAEIFLAGARDFVAGTSIFNHPSGIIAGIEALKSGINI